MPRVFPPQPSLARKDPQLPASVEPSWPLGSLQVPAVARSGLQSLKLAIVRMGPHSPAGAETTKAPMFIEAFWSLLWRVWAQYYQKIGNVLQAIMQKNPRVTLNRPQSYAAVRNDLENSLR
jgi:hypothetical protein